MGAQVFDVVVLNRQQLNTQLVERRRVNVDQVVVDAEHQ